MGFFRVLGVLIAVASLVAEHSFQGARGSHRGGFSCCRAQLPECSGFSLRWLLLLQSTASRVLRVLIAVASLVAEHSFQDAQASVVVAHTLSSCSA